MWEGRECRRKADGAGACDVNRGKGLWEGRLPEVEDTARGYGIAEAVGAGGLDAVEHDSTETRRSSG